MYPQEGEASPNSKERRSREILRAGANFQGDEVHRLMLLIFFATIILMITCELSKDSSPYLRLLREILIVHLLSLQIRREINEGKTE